MGSLILCHSKRAKRPYEISRVHMRIYTIEELCYYLCNNLCIFNIFAYSFNNRTINPLSKAQYNKVHHNICPN